MCILLLLAIAAALLMTFFDINYYVRMILTIVYGRLFQKKCRITDKTGIYGLCFTQDLDIVGSHMNNARFVRDLDFARFHFYDRTGLYSEMVKRKTTALQVATSIRYRRVIPFGSFYKVETKMIWWDERSIYLEQNFITNDAFVRAVALSKATVLKGNVDDIMKSLNACAKPELCPDLDHWIKSMEFSSLKYKPQAGKKTE